MDAAHPAELGRWWANALGWVVVFEAEDEFEIRPAPDRLPGLVFVPVGDPRLTKNRLHPDFRPDDQAAEVNRLLELGARRADIGQGEPPWVVCRSGGQRVLRPSPSQAAPGRHPARCPLDLRQMGRRTVDKTRPHISVSRLCQALGRCPACRLSLHSRNWGGPNSV